MLLLMAVDAENEKHCLPSDIKGVPSGPANILAMAEVVVDQEGPLHEYFQESGDLLGRTIPGGLDVIPEASESDELDQTNFLQLIISIVMAGRSLFVSSAASSKEFAERFKYIIISSSILSDTIAPTAEHPADEAGEANRTEEASVERGVATPSPSLWTAPALLAAAFAARSPLALIAASSWILQAYYKPTIAIEYETPSAFSKALCAATALVKASDKFDVSIRQALRCIEEDELRPSPHPAIDELRYSLYVTCDKTKSQISNIRQLFSPLTSTLELKMLSEMYSPMPVTPGPEHRWQSLSLNGRIESSHPKRATWSGSRAAPQTPTRRQFASELGTSFDLDRSPYSASSTAPGPEEVEDEESFGMSALRLQRRRRGKFGTRRMIRPPTEPRDTDPGLHMFGEASSSYQFPPLITPSPPKCHPGPSGERRIQRRRSLNSIRNSVQCCLGSRRFAASHLLALRFNEHTDDTYWQDTVEVIDLFASTLEEASTLVSSRLDEADIMILADQVPTPALKPVIRTSERRISDIFPLPSSQLESFAPMPDSLATFASHMDAMSTAVDNAKNRLRACLGVLRSSPASPDGTELDQDEIERLRQMVITEYSEVRRNLGNAIRECERGRSPLMAAVGFGADTGGAVNGRELSLEQVPPFSPQEDSPYSPRKSHEGGTQSSSRSSIVFTPDSAAADGNAHLVDVFDEDRAWFFRQTESFHLPPHQPEHVYEAESEAPLFTREKSKLSRAERIALVNQHRAAGRKGVPLPRGENEEAESEVGNVYKERWGPGGDVVQELKDVITIVGEKRRGKSNSGQPDIPQLRDPAPSPGPPSPLLSRSLQSPPTLPSPIPVGSHSPLLSASSDGSRSSSPISSPLPLASSSNSPTSHSPDPKRPAKPIRPIPVLPSIPSDVLDGPATSND